LTALQPRACLFLTGLLAVPWLRAKFFMQYRSFFRYHGEGKIIALGTVS
jgi:hypothetical protein